MSIVHSKNGAILRGLAEGKSRDELAAEFGYKNYKSLDIYMRRKNFIWDRVKQTYVPEFSRVDVKSIHARSTGAYPP